jgi:hypothetical protein
MTQASWTRCSRLGPPEARGRDLSHLPRLLMYCATSDPTLVPCSPRGHLTARGHVSRSVPRPIRRATSTTFQPVVREGRRNARAGARPSRKQGCCRQSLRLIGGVTALETSEQEGVAPLPLSVGRERLPSHRAVHSRREALADPQGSLNGVPLGPATGNRILFRDDTPLTPRCRACENQRFKRRQSPCRSRTRRRRSGPSPPPGGTNLPRRPPVSDNPVGSDRFSVPR